jgi:nucleoside-diphosphate-sugar epimerase
MPEFGARVVALRGDVGQPADVEAAVGAAEPDLVYHLAAETGTGQSHDEPTRYCRGNVLGTTHLIEALRRTGTARRVVLAASRAVYGEGAYRDQQGLEWPAATPPPWRRALQVPLRRPPGAGHARRQPCRPAAGASLDLRVHQADAGIPAGAGGRRRS